jgi:hypothetical protein
MADRGAPQPLSAKAHGAALAAAGEARGGHRRVFLPAVLRPAERRVAGFRVGLRATGFADRFAGFFAARARFAPVLADRDRPALFARRTFGAACDTASML